MPSLRAASLCVKSDAALRFTRELLRWDLAGARAVYTNDDIGRIFLDILVATRHVTQNLDINATDHGRARVNLRLTNPSL